MATESNDPLARYRAVLPSRAQLARLSLFGSSEEIRTSAQTILDTLPPMTEKERIEYYAETWKLATPLDDSSPVGKATLELLRSSKPLASDKTEDRAIAAPEQPAMDAQVVTNASPPAIEHDGVNEHLRRLAWPPKSSPPPKPVEDDGQPHKWVAGTPSKPDTSQRPLAPSDWDDRPTIY